MFENLNNFRKFSKNLDLSEKFRNILLKILNF